MKLYYKILVTLFLFLLSSIVSFAQLPADHWRTHMSYVQGEKLAIAENKVYCLASGSLFSYGLDDNSVDIYTKITGLNDVYINDIAYCDKTETLVICYSTGNIDLLSEQGIVNVPDLKLKPMFGSKDINKIDIYDGFAYLSADFGVVKLNIEKSEISETYTFTNGGSNPVNALAILDDKIYAATDNGLYKASKNSANLQNFAEWSLATGYNRNNLPILDIAIFSNQLIIVQSVADATDGSKYIAYRLEHNTWKRVIGVGSFAHLGASDQKLTISCNIVMLQYDKDFQLEKQLKFYNFSTLEFPNQNVLKARHAIYKDDVLFLSDNMQGLVIFQEDQPSINIRPKGPATNVIWDIDIVGNIVRTVHGANTSTYNNTWTAGAFSTFKDNNWSFISSNYGGPNYKEYVGIATDPLDPEHFFISSFGYGVLEFQDDELINHYNEDNSTLVSAIAGNNKYLRTLGVYYDENNNLWISSGSSGPQFHVFTKDQKWHAFESNLTDKEKRYTQIAVVDNAKWIATPRWGKGILVYDDNGTYDNDLDDKDKFFSINDGSEHISDKVFTITKDNDGTIWVGSDNGVALYYNPQKIFENSGTPKASRILIPRNDGTGHGDYLLDKETVYDIAVDGGNRKWIATYSSGVYLVSADGKTVINHFTDKNSPLLSNNVRTIDINDETGEVFFGTNAGLISFQADASIGGEDFSSLKVYPNPVREDFFGNITIAGLVDETTVKVTDVSGNLVYETISNGGTATWNCKNFYGERVGTGVYLIFCSDKEGDKSVMTKVMLVN